MIYKASWLRFSGTSSLSDNIQVNPIHLNASNGGGIGVQYIIEQAILAHNHVDYDLLIEKFPAFADQLYYGWYRENNIYNGTTKRYRDPVDTSSSDNAIPWFDSNEAVFEDLAALTLNWISSASYGVGNPLVETPESLILKNFTWNSATTNNFTYNPSSYNNATVEFGSAYGFDRSGMFTNGICPVSVDVASIDVNKGRNSTFVDHINDLSIHRLQMPPVTVINQQDHMAFWGGSLNFYGTKLYEIEYTTAPMFMGDVNTPIDLVPSRKDDDFPFNKFIEDDEYYDLDRVGVAADSSLDHLENNMLHPLLYEEAVYMWNGQKIKQYKLIKADPDDIAVAAQRKGQDPMSSILTGGYMIDVNQSVSFDPVTEQYIRTVNTAADTYFYNNFYYNGKNTEYNPFDESRIVASLQADGLGAQPLRGVAGGV